ncbi:MAG: hypothetical protein LH466_09300 [Sphingomonas bacterium]|nr:hypothetical protein [Sphingomonas bacterium]
MLHAVLIAFFLLSSARMPETVKPTTTIALIAINAERPAAAKPPPPALPAKIADTFKPITELSIPSDSDVDAPAGATGACSTQGAVLDALLSDPVVVETVRHSPPETRSIAKAIVIWNEGWSPAAIAFDSPLGPVRANIEQSLGKIAGHCLDEPVAGPRLLPIPDGTDNGALFLVFGSGNWAWRALLTQPLPVEAPESASRGAEVAPQQ